MAYIDFEQRFKSIDSDNDGVGSNTDDDNDGLNDVDETNLNGTNPLSSDTDNDGMLDGWEIQHHLQAVINDTDLDSDKDGVRNLDEFTADSDPSPPVLVRSYPQHNQVDVSSTSVLEVVFSKSIAFDSVDEYSVVLTDGNSDVQGDRNVVEDKLTFTPKIPLQSNHDYVLRINHTVTDLAGNELNSNIQISFTTQSGYQISGSAMESGVLLNEVLFKLIDGSSESVIESADGNFSFIDQESGSYIITASKLGYIFTPEKIQVQVDGSGLSEVNFEAVSVPTIKVPADYPTIQSAIDNAINGATILVDDGEYVENLSINKPVTLESVNGAALTKIRAQSHAKNVVFVNAPNVTVKGFDLFGSVYYPAIYFAAESHNGCIEDNLCGYDRSHFNHSGIEVVGSDNIEIRNNDCHFFGLFGIRVKESNNAIVQNNRVSDQDRGGISIYKCSGCRVEKNTVTKNQTGIKLSRGKNNKVMGNNSSSNNKHGIHVDDVGGDNYVGENITSSNKGVGIKIESSGITEIVNNEVNQNSISGISVYQSFGSKVLGNTTKSNRYYGIYIRTSDGCSVVDNIVESNNEGGGLS
jgi:parallel beta-helix repeat protein